MIFRASPVRGESHGRDEQPGWAIARGQICPEQICMSEASPKGKGRTPVVIIAIAMDQGGSPKMRRQIVHKTTRTKCNLSKLVYFCGSSLETQQRLTIVRPPSCNMRAKPLLCVSLCAICELNTRPEHFCCRPA